MLGYLNLKKLIWFSWYNKFSIIINKYSSNKYEFWKILDGKEKISKSLGNYIGVDESPEKMYEKAMRIPDDVLEEFINQAEERYNTVAKGGIPENIEIFEIKKVC